MHTKKLKVLQLGKQYYPHIGGIEATMQQIAEGIQGQVDSYVLASQEKGNGYAKVINGVPVYYAKSHGVIASLPISFDLVWYLCKHANEYDVIHLHMPFPLGDLACLLSGFKGKIVLYWHSDIVRQKKAMIFYKPLMKWMLKRADAITIATQGNIDGSPYVKPYENKCVLIPFGLRKEWEEKSDIYWAQKETESPKKDLNLLFIGRLVYYKGCDILVSAFAKLKKELPEEKLARIQLRIIGTGVLEDQLKQMVKTEKLENQIHFLGRISDAEMEDEIKNSDVFVFPSVANSEAFGLVQLETMAYGKPVINTSLPTGVPWVSLHEQTGLTVSPNDISALKNAILWMLDNPDERYVMGERARKRVKEEFSQKQMIEKLVDLYEELCK